MVRILLVIVLVVIGGYYVLANHSVSRTNLVCTQTTGSTGTIFLKFEIYRPWVWGESDGNLFIEEQDGFLRYYAHLEVLDLKTFIRDSSDSAVVGSYSQLSKQIFINLSSGAFEGECRES